MKDDALEELRDKVEGLSADLYCAVEVAYLRGATEWTRLNYPEIFKRFQQPETAVAPQPDGRCLSLCKPDCACNARLERQKAPATIP